MTEIGVYEIESSEHIQNRETNLDTHSKMYNDKRYQTSVKRFIFCAQIFIMCGVISFAVYNISTNRGNPTTWSELIQASLEHILARPSQKLSLINSTTDR